LKYLFIRAHKADRIGEQEISPEALGILAVGLILLGFIMLFFPELVRYLWKNYIKSLWYPRKGFEDTEDNSKAKNMFTYLIQFFGLLLLIFGGYLFWDTEGFYYYWFNEGTNGPE
jgi:hypothetical protein